MFNAAREAYDPEAPRRKRVQGPVGAMLEAIQRAGWTAITANRWRCARGGDILLREGSIPMIRALHGRDIVDAYVARDIKLGLHLERGTPVEGRHGKGHREHQAD